VPLQIVPYQQQSSPSAVGAPRASAPALVDPTGAAVQQLAGQVMKIGADMYQVQREADLHDRVGKFTAELSSLELQFDRDQDFRTAPQRFKEQADTLRDKYLDGVGDQAVATAFRRQAQTLLTSKQVNVIRGAWKKEADYQIASLDTNIDTYATSAANARNPGEATVVENQARLAIASAQANGWLSAEEAGKRERTFLQKRDSAIVIRDMSIDPVMTAAKLTADPTYAQNIAPEQRALRVAEAFRRSESEQRQRDAAAERARKARGDELYKEALNLNSKGNLTPAFVEQIRPFVEPSEYKSLLGVMAGTERTDDPQAYSTLEGLVETNPAEARRQAFLFHRNGRIRNETLASINNRSRTIERQEGPRTEFERSRQFIADTLRPSPLVNDPAGSARYALAVREFDDFAGAAQRTDAELREKSNDIQKRYALVDMADLARRTASGIQPSPEQQLKTIAADAEKLIADHDAKRLTTPEFNRRMADLNKAREAAEKASRANGRK
jgi:hypothetical protein